MSSSPGAVRGPVVVLALVGAFLLAGCGDDAQDGPGAASSTDASSTASQDAEPSDTPSESASGDASESASESASDPAVAPAAGPTVELEGMTLNVPEGWEVSNNAGRTMSAFDTGDSDGAIAANIVSLGPGESLESYAATVLDSAQSDGLKPQRLEDRTVGGVQAFVVSGGSKLIPLQVQVGGLTDADSFVLTFGWISKPPADAQDIIDSVLASVTFS